MEDCEDYEQVAQHLDAPGKKTAKAPAKSPFGMLPDDPSDIVDADDVCMRIFCFFEDVNKLRSQLKEIWRSYSQDSHQLIAATMATNAAIAIIDQMEKELLESLPSESALLEAFNMPSFSRAAPYMAIIGILAADTFGIGVLDPVAACSELGKFWLFDIALIVAKCSRGFIERFQSQGSLTQVKANAKKRGGKWQMPPGWKAYPHIWSLRATALRTSKWADQLLNHPAFDAFEACDELLTPILMDTYLRREQLDAESSIPAGPVRHTDQLTTSLLELFQTGMSTAVVFGVAAMYDIHSALGDSVAEPWRILQTRVNEYWDRVKYNHYDPKNPTPKIGPSWLVGDAGDTALIERCKLLIEDDRPWSSLKAASPKCQPFHTYRLNESDKTVVMRSLLTPGLNLTQIEVRARRIQALNKPFILPSRDRDLYWVGNPLASGTFLYNISITMNRAGICLANYHLSICWMAYLYTGMTNQNMLRGSWPELEKVIGVHLSSMFFGSTLNAPNKLFNTFMLRLGAKVPSKGVFNATQRLTIIGIGAIKTGKKPRDQAGASCLSISDTTDIAAQWGRGQHSTLQVVHLVHKVMYPSAGKKAKNMIRFAPLTFLNAFRDHMMKETDHMSIDYVGLPRFCSDLLSGLLHSKRIMLPDSALNPDNYYTRQSSTPSNEHPDRVDPSNTNNPVLAHLVKNILWEDKEWEEKMQSQDKKLAKQNKLAGRVSWLSVAGQWCQEYLDKKGVPVKDSTDTQADGTKGAATTRASTPLGITLKTEHGSYQVTDLIGNKEMKEILLSDSD